MLKDMDKSFAFDSKLCVAFSPVKSWWNGLRQMRWAVPIVMVSRPFRPWQSGDCIVRVQVGEPSELMNPKP
jgi:hypothetical protein